MKSFWNNAENTKFSKLDKDIEVDVCIIGAGITGISTAYNLIKAGKSVAILEKDLVASHTTGGSTGKITSQHGLIYKYLCETFDKEYARKYYNANEKALKNIEEIINTENIECDFEKKSAYVYTQYGTEMDKIKQEVEYTKKIGVNSSFATEIDLPLKIVGAIKFENQAQFNPVKYVNGLINVIVKKNGQIFENSKVIDIEEKNNRYIVSTESGKVLAKDVVVATRYPIINFPGYYFLKMYQSTSYAMVFYINTDFVTEGFYINVEQPTISLRTVKSGNKNLLLIVGYDYKTGSEIIGNPFEYLESKVTKMYPGANKVASWTAEDCISLDKIPYIGNFSKVMNNIYVATGFNKWGISTSNIAADIITDKIMGRKNEYEEIFKSSRLNPIKNKEEMMNMLKESGNGIILRKIKDAPNPNCTHLGCTLSWNPIEETWDCACHGSRFTENGKVIEGPAIKDL